MINNIVFSNRIKRLTSSLVRELLALTEQPGIISFAGGLPAQKLMPKIGLDTMPDTIGQYGLSDGESDLRKTIAGEINRIGLNCTAEQIIVTAGSQQGIDLLSKLFIDEGTVIFVEQPVYLAALQVFNLFGAQVIGVGITPDGIDLDELQEKLEQYAPAFLYINPTFQNPTGYTYSANKRRALADLLDQYNIPLIEDDPYRELRYSGNTECAVSSLLKVAPWAYLGSFSKVSIPAWRIGYTISHPDIAAHLIKIKQGTDLHTNRPGQWWCNQFLKDRVRYESHISELKKYYTLQRDAMEQALNKYMKDIAYWRKPEGGLFYWLTLNSSIDTALLLEEALKRNVAYLPGGAFYPAGDVSNNSIRLSFSEVSIENIDIGIARLASLFETT